MCRQAQVIELEPRGPAELRYDEEWLAVLRSSHSKLSLQRRAAQLPAPGAPGALPSPADRDAVRQALGKHGRRVSMHSNLKLTCLRLC